MEEKKRGNKTGLIVTLSIIIGVLVAIVAIGIFFINYLVATEDEDDIQTMQAKATSSTDDKGITRVFDDGSIYTLSLSDENTIVVTIIGSNEERTSFIFAGLLSTLKDCYQTTTTTISAGYKDSKNLKGLFTIVYRNGQPTGTLPEWCKFDEDNTNLSDDELKEYANWMIIDTTDFKRLINK